MKLELRTTNKTIMKKLLVIFTMVALTGCHSFTRQNESNNCAFYESEELQKMVIEYGNAMNELASSSLEFGSDTETQWAIDTVNQIWKNCKAQPFDFIQYMADISSMERYFAYGIDYVPMLMYWSKHYHDPNQPIYKLAFDDFAHVVDSLRQVIRTSGEWSDYFMMHACSLTLVDLYFAFCDDLNEYDMEPPFNALNISGLIDELYSKDGVDPLYHAMQLDGASFYHTYCMFIGRMSKEVSEKLTDYAYTMDDYTQTIMTSWSKDEKLPVLTADDNQSFLKEALPIYTDMLKMLTERMKEVE